MFAVLAHHHFPPRSADHHHLHHQRSARRKEKRYSLQSELKYFFLFCQILFFLSPESIFQKWLIHARMARFTKDMNTNTTQKQHSLLVPDRMGLTAALELFEKTDIKPIVLEMSDKIGGISRTEIYKGNRIDIGDIGFFQI